MAVTNASQVQVHGHTAPSGGDPGKVGATDPGDYFVCFVSFIVTGTYAQANNSSIVGLGGASGSIAASRRDGKTVTLVDAMIAAPGIFEAGGSPTFAGAKTIAISTADVTFELTKTDLATEFDDATLIPAWDQPLVFAVVYKLTPG